MCAGVGVGESVVGVCVCERERGREGEKEREETGEKERRGEKRHCHCHCPSAIKLSCILSLLYAAEWIPLVPDTWHRCTAGSFAGHAASSALPNLTLSN